MGNYNVKPWSCVVPPQVIHGEQNYQGKLHCAQVKVEAQIIGIKIMSTDLASAAARESKWY